MLTFQYILNHPGDPEARREWAATLKEPVLRSLANDYREGDLDPAAYDAWVELKRRFDEGRIRGQQRCEAHTGRRGRFPSDCPACSELAGINEPTEMSVLAAS